MTAGRVEVGVADDHPLFRQALAETVRSDPHSKLVGVASDGSEALALLEESRPEVALLDLAMPRLSGLEVVRAAGSRELPTKLLMLSAETDGAVIHEALEAGVTGFLSKSADPSSVIAAIHAAARDEITVSPNLQPGVFSRISKGATPASERLTAREQEILRMAAAGTSGHEIGRALTISPATVKTHLQRAYEKLGVNDRTAAVAEALRRGLIR